MSCFKRNLSPLGKEVLKIETRSLTIHQDFRKQHKIGKCGWSHSETLGATTCVAHFWRRSRRKCQLHQPQRLANSVEKLTTCLTRPALPQDASIRICQTTNTYQEIHISYRFIVYVLCQTPNTILNCINVMSLMSHALLSSFQCMAGPLGLCSGVDIALRTARPSPCENRTFREFELQSATGTVSL